MRGTKDINKIKVDRNAVGASIARPLLRRVDPNKGITLLALVITIVIMLIIVGVTVNVAIDGGLFEYAGKAKYETELANEKEQIQKAAILAKEKSKTGRITVGEMQEAINKVINEDAATAIDNGDTIVVQFKDSGRYYEVDNKGNVGDPIEIIFDTEAGVLDGTGTEEDPFVIMSIEDLVYFSQQVNSGTSYSGKYVVLGKTLDFKSDLSYIDINTTEYDEFLGGDGETGLKEQLTKGLGFMPINNFSGTFDGQNNWIKNIYIDKDADNVGFFGTTGNAIIEKLNISGYINGLTKVGGFIGYSNLSVRIINCNNYTEVNGNSVVGGLVGQAINASIENCNNYGTIIGIGINNAELCVGGIAGNNGNISKCTNHGSVSGYGSTGGICGHANSAKIYECVNIGSVDGNQNIGGICGNSGNGGLAERCYNLGQITGKMNVGGIVGNFYRNGKIQCAYNGGEIIGEKNVGGIMGTGDGNKGALNCYNIGEIIGSSSTSTGQVIGTLSTGTTGYHKNLYYLNTASSKGIGNMEDIEGVVEGKTSTELKADTLLGVFNGNHTHNVDGAEVDYTSNCWVKDTENINSGYPILSWQVD